MAEMPWDRQPKESEPAWAAFQLYRDQRLGRSHQAVARQCSKSISIIRRWSARWSWVERAGRWDSYQDGIHLAAATKAVEDAAINWAAEREIQRGRELETGRALIARALLMLETPLYRREVTTNDGHTTNVFIPAGWRMSDAPKLADIGAKLVRLAAEMDTDRIGVTHRQELEAEAERLSADSGMPIEDVYEELDKILAERHR